MVVDPAGRDRCSGGPTEAGGMDVAAHRPVRRRSADDLIGDLRQLLHVGRRCRRRKPGVGVPAVFILLKPSLAPFVVFGIDRRSWWRGLAVLGIASLAMLPMWPDWITAITNIRGDDWTHNGFDVAFILIPILAFMGSSDRSHHVVVLSPLRDWVVRRAAGVDDGG